MLLQLYNSNNLGHVISFYQLPANQPTSLQKSIFYCWFIIHMTLSTKLYTVQVFKHITYHVIIQWSFSTWNVQDHHKCLKTSSQPFLLHFRCLETLVWSHYIYYHNPRSLCLIAPCHTIFRSTWLSAELMKSKLICCLSESSIIFEPIACISFKFHLLIPLANKPFFLLIFEEKNVFFNFSWFFFHILVNIAPRKQKFKNAAPLTNCSWRFSNLCSIFIQWSHFCDLGALVTHVGFKAILG